MLNSLTPSHRTRTPLLKTIMSIRIRALFSLIVLAALTLASCDNLEKKTIADPVQKPQEQPHKAMPSALALQKVSERDIRFAQTALSQLGYRLGVVDGFWGDRSEKAMQEFEVSRKLESAGGALSELNLYALSKATKVRISEIESSIKKSRGLAAKLDASVPLSEAPQLIIVDQPYPVLAKANPYSETLTTLQPGTGIYVISIQDGWFEIESVSRYKGYIREN